MSLAGPLTANDVVEALIEAEKPLAGEEVVQMLHDYGPDWCLDVPQDELLRQVGLVLLGRRDLFRRGSDDRIHLVQTD